MTVETDKRPARKSARKPGSAEQETARLRRIIDHASQEIYVCDVESFTILEANRAARQNLGYTIDELRAMAPMDLVPHMSQNDLQATLAPLFSGELDEVVAEAEHRRKDGSIYPITVRCELDRTVDPPMLIAYVTDQTEAIETLAQIRLAAGAGAFHFTKWYLNGERIVRDPGVDRLYGFDDHDPRRGIDAFRSRVAAEDLPGNIAAFEAVAHGESTVFDRTFRVRWPDGTQRWLRAMGQPSQHNPNIMVGLQCDVTDTVLAEQGREQTRRDMEALLRTLPDYISRAKPDSTLTFVNGPYAQFLGRTPDALIGEKFLEFVPEQHRGDLQQALAGLTPETPTVTTEERSTNPDGTITCLLWTNMMTFDGDRPVELISVGRNISDQDNARLTIEAQANDLQRSNAALRESEERFQLAVKGTSVGIWDWPLDADGVQFWSEKLYELLGLAPGAVPPHIDSFTDLVHPDDLDMVMERIDRHLATGEKYECTFRLRHATGEYRWFIDTGTAARDRDGKPVRMVGTMMDIHDRKVAEAALRQSEERFQLAVQGASVGIWDWQISAGGKQYLSDKIYELLGYAPGEIDPSFDSFFLERLHPDDRKRAERAIDRHLKHGAKYESEFRLRHRSGQYRWFLDTGAASRDADGNPVRMVGTMMDIHDRKVAEAEQRESAARFRTLYNDTPVMLHSIDAAGNIISVSDFWLDKLGYDREDVLGRPSVDFMTAASRKRVQEVELPRFFATGVSRDVPLKLVRRDGSVIDVLLSAVAVYSEDGGIDRSLAVVIDVTEKKRIEDALALKQRELELIFDNVPVRIWYKDDQNRVLRLNRRAAEAIGRPAEEIEGRVVTDWAPPELAARFHREDLEVIRSGVPKLGIVEQRTTADGRIEWMRTDKVPFTDPETGKTLLLATSTDITEQKAAEFELARQKRELQLIFDNVPVKIFYKDDQNRILRLNRRAANSMGMDVADAEGRDTYDLFPELADKYHDDDLEVINSGRPKLGIIEEYVPLSGERQWISTDKVPYTDPDTGDRHVLVTVTDITALKQAEAELESQRQELQLIFENVPVKLFYKDGHNHVLRANRLAAESLGLTVEEAEGCDIYDIFDEDQALMYHADDIEVIKSGRPKLGVIKEFTPVGGAPLWISSNKVPYRDPLTGEPRILLAVTDITALKTAQLTMAEQAKALQRSNEELEQFAYVASHDLKAPLRGIDNLASWLEEDLADRLDDESRNNFRLMRTRVARLEQLLTSLLDYSRIGRRRSAVTQVDLDEVATEVFDLVRGQRNFALECRDLPVLVTGEVPLELVLRNLFANAIKHHDRDHGTITVTAQDDGDHYRFSVADDGPGIEPKYHKQVFGMFQVLKPRDQVEASGLGLAMIDKQLRALDCAIEIESDPAERRGTTFHFTWPKVWPFGAPAATGGEA